MSQIIKKKTSIALSTFIKDGFPKFKVIATKSKNGKINGEVVWMKAEKQKNTSNKYVTHKELKEELSNYVTKSEFRAFREEVNNQFKEVNNQFKEVNNQFKEVNNNIDTKFGELKQLIINK